MGHPYDSIIASRTGKVKSGCPYCAGKRVSDENNLKFKFPEVAVEWHPSKNGDLKPEEFTGHSNKKVWWLCPKGHSYDASINNRTGKNSRGCPYCAGKRVSNENNLLFLFPKIASEWHPTKNGELKPDEVSYGSNKKVWWLCPKGHSYNSVISDRTRKKPQGCIHCYRKSS